MVPAGRGGSTGELGEEVEGEEEEGDELRVEGEDDEVEEVLGLLWEAGLDTADAAGKPAATGGAAGEEAEGEGWDRVAGCGDDRVLEVVGGVRAEAGVRALINNSSMRGGR